MHKEWFTSWFDSPYYHTLYKNRDENEARKAIDSLLNAMHLPAGARVLDLACGKGRHARYLSAQGFDVTGLDISEASIRFARQFEHDHLAFYQHDMRLPFRIRYFDAVVNFFTSFGYFENDDDHLKTLKNVAMGLRAGGVFLLDFFNSAYVRSHLVQQEEKTVESIHFRIQRRTEDGYVFKTVAFNHEGRTFHFEEKVRLFTLSELEHMFDAAGLSIRACYGSYDLDAYDEATSTRLILLAEKNQPK